MKKIRTFFQPYIDVSELSETIADGEIQKVEINQQIRMLSLQVSFLDLVQRKDLFALEKAIWKSPLELQKVELFPHFPKERFSEDYINEIFCELKRRDASLTGCFKDAQVTLQDEKLNITLMHGGFELLKSRHVDRCLQKLVMDEFGIPLTVSFDGTLTIDHESSVYIERKKQQEEEERRKKEEEIKRMRQEEWDNNTRYGSGDIMFTSLELCDVNDHDVSTYKTGDTMTLKAKYKMNKPVQDVVFGIGVFRNDDLWCYGTNTKIERFEKFDVNRDGEYDITFTDLNLIPGQYWMNVSIEYGADGAPIDFYKQAIRFEVVSNVGDIGVVRIPHKWQIKN